MASKAGAHCVEFGPWAGHHDCEGSRLRSVHTSTDGAVERGHTVLRKQRAIALRCLASHGGQVDEAADA